MEKLKCLRDTSAELFRAAVNEVNWALLITNVQCGYGTTRRRSDPCSENIWHIFGTFAFSKFFKPFLRPINPYTIRLSFWDD